MPAHEKIRAWRRHRKISQDTLAHLLRPYLPGLDDSDISRIETGKRKVLADEIPYFALVLKCEVTDLLDKITRPQAHRF